MLSERGDVDKSEGSQKSISQSIKSINESRDEWTGKQGGKWMNE